MKKLILLWLFSGSLDLFSQVSDTNNVKFDFHEVKETKIPRYFDHYGRGIKETPDTLRATLIVYYDNGPAILHTKPGFVVMGKEFVYLDDRKRVIKAPWEVLTYKVKK